MKMILNYVENVVVECGEQVAVPASAKILVSECVPYRARSIRVTQQPKKSRSMGAVAAAPVRAAVTVALKSTTLLSL